MISQSALIVCIAILTVILWILALQAVKEFFNHYCDWTKPIWLFKILTYTPVINFICLVTLIIIGLFAVLLEALGNPFEDLFNKKKV